MKKKPFTPDWANIPEQYNWLAVDRDGNIAAFTNRPRIDIRKGAWLFSDYDYRWEQVGDCMTMSILALSIFPAIDPPGKKWRTMLYERPKQ